MTKLPTNGCKSTCRHKTRHCRILRLLDTLEQKCLQREATIAQINDKQLFEDNKILLNEILNLKNKINI